MGIGGLDKEFSDIFRRAFASRVFPPDIVEQMGESLLSLWHFEGKAVTSFLSLLWVPSGPGPPLVLPQNIKSAWRPCLSLGKTNPSLFKWPVRQRHSMLWATWNTQFERKRTKPKYISVWTDSFQTLPAPHPNHKWENCSVKKKTSLSSPLPLAYGQKPSLNYILRLQSDCVFMINIQPLYR